MIFDADTVPLGESLLSESHLTVTAARTISIDRNEVQLCSVRLELGEASPLAWQSALRNGGSQRIRSYTPFISAEHVNSAAHVYPFAYLPGNRIGVS